MHCSERMYAMHLCIFCSNIEYFYIFLCKHRNVCVCMRYVCVLNSTTASNDCIFWKNAFDLRVFNSAREREREKDFVNVFVLNSTAWLYVKEIPRNGHILSLLLSLSFRMLKLMHQHTYYTSKLIVYKQKHILMYLVASKRIYCFAYTLTNWKWERCI